MNNKEEVYKLYNDFQKQFSIDKLKNLTLEEYTNLDRDNSFCYWLETRTEKLGSIWGGSAYKFGIFRIAGVIKTSKKAKNDGVYAWYEKYGDTKEIVFKNILSNIIEVAEAAHNKDFSKIDDIDLGTSYKWKIAFLYSDMELLHIYKEDAIRYLAKNHGLENAKKASISQIQSYLISQKDDEDLFDYSEKLWEEWKTSDEYKKHVDTEDDEFLDSDNEDYNSSYFKNSSIKPFSLNQFANDSFSIRYINSLLAKPFTILAGNSGTGKTRIAIKIANIYTAKIPDFTKNLKEVFEYILDKNYDMNGIRIKSVSDTAIEVFNTKDKLICISFGIIQEYIDWYDANGTDSNPIRNDMQIQGKYDGQSYSWDTSHIEKIAKFICDYQKKNRRGVYVKNSLLIPVGADWTDNTKILGFYNPLKKEYQSTPVLDFILLAAQNPEIPFFLILDEMNLSHVERYFSDFLSAMESGEPIPLYKKDADAGSAIPEKITLPKNLFVTGTVNIDETTYMFSPKVLDRANVIEFKPEKDGVLALLLDDSASDEAVPAAPGIAEGFMQLANEVRSGKIPDGLSDVLNKIKPILDSVYTELEKCGFEFAYRTAKEIRLYAVAALKTAEKDPLPDATEIADIQILQKILPKIHGNKKQIGGLLENLETLCKEKSLSGSLAKIRQMKTKLNNFQYASFI